MYGEDGRVRGRAKNKIDDLGRTVRVLLDRERERGGRPRGSLKSLWSSGQERNEGARKFLGTDSTELKRRETGQQEALPPEKPESPQWNPPTGTDPTPLEQHLQREPVRGLSTRAPGCPGRCKGDPK